MVAVTHNTPNGPKPTLTPFLNAGFSLRESHALSNDEASQQRAPAAHIDHVAEKAINKAEPSEQIKNGVTSLTSLISRMPAATMEISKAVIGCERGETFVVTIGNSHYSFSRTSNDNLEVQEGFKQKTSPTSVRRNGQLFNVDGSFELKAGDTIILGKGTEISFNPTSGAFDILDRKRWAMLEASPVGSLFPLGRDRITGWNIHGEGVEHFHCVIKKSSQGNYVLHNELKNNATALPIELQSGSGTWSSVSPNCKIVIPGAAIIKVAGNEVIIPPPGVAELKEQGGRSSALRSDGSTSWIRTPLPEGTFNQPHVECGTQKVKLIGAPPNALGTDRIIRGLEDHSNYKLPEAIVVVPSIGFEFKSGKGCVPIRALAEIGSESGTTLFITPEVYSSPLHLQQALTDYSRRHSQCSHLADMKQRENNSILVENQIQENVDKNAIPNNSWPISRNTPISGGFSARKYGAGGIENVLVHVDKHDPRLLSLVDSFLRGQGITPHPATESALPLARQKELLSMFAAHVKDNVCTNDQLIRDVAKFVKQGKLPAEYATFSKADLNVHPQMVEWYVMNSSPPLKVGNTAVIKLGDYVQAGSGMCEQQNTLVAFFGEECQRRGIISNSVEIRMAKNYASIPPGIAAGLSESLRLKLPELPGHAWTQVRWTQVEIEVYDSAQRYTGSLVPRGSETQSRWLYCSNQQLDDVLQAPL